MRPKVTVLLITVRPNNSYVKFPDWHVLGKTIDELNQQTFKDFEFIIVDGLCGHKDRDASVLDKANFPVRHIAPKENLWTRTRLVNISNYRNTGLAWAQGELVVNLDDCCTIPPVYLELFWRGWNEKKICLASTWVLNGDQRIDRNLIRNPNSPYVHPHQAHRGSVFGFGSYPLQMALELNGYDEAYDGAMYLEDIDFSTRLADYGLPMHLCYLPGFRLEDQSGHHPDVIDPKVKQVKCCNAAWQTQQVWRTVVAANKPELWSSDEALNRLLGPCFYMTKDQKCMHWGGKQGCEYVKEEYLDANGKSFALERNKLANWIFEEPPVRDLEEERKQNDI